VSQSLMDKGRERLTKLFSNHDQLNSWINHPRATELVCEIVKLVSSISNSREGKGSTVPVLVVNECRVKKGTRERPVE